MVSQYFFHELKEENNPKNSIKTTPILMISTLFSYGSWVFIYLSGRPRFLSYHDFSKSVNETSTEAMLAPCSCAGADGEERVNYIKDVSLRSVWG